MKSIALGATVSNPMIGKFLTAFPWYSRAGFSSGMRQLDSRNRVLADDETVYLLHLSICSSFQSPKSPEKFP
jgi:hypothetical protein